MSEQIIAYDPSWPKQFAHEARRLQVALAALALRIEHVGSTAVPGLCAKPIIDIQIVVRDRTAAESCRLIFARSGYTEAALPIQFFHRPASWPHSHHVHVREQGGVEATRLLSFRDWLRAHPEDREAYAAIKRDLAQQGDLHDLAQRVRYSEAKTAFVRDIEWRAAQGRRAGPKGF